MKRAVAAFFLTAGLPLLAMANDPSASCVAGLTDDAKVQPLLKKIPLDISKGQSLEVLANQSKPNAKEKVALIALGDALDNCTELGADWRKQNYPTSINGYVESYQTSFKGNLADLYAGKLTFGDFAKIRAKEQSELKNKVDLEAQRVLAERETIARQQKQDDEDRRAKSAKQIDDYLAQQRNAQQIQQQQQAQVEEARRQAAIQFMLNRPQPQVYQQLIPYQVPIPQTRTTNCNTFGNQTNCTTR